MAELMRFRIARAPQKRVPDTLSLLILDVSSEKIKTIASQKLKKNLRDILSVDLQDVNGTASPALISAFRSKIALHNYFTDASPFLQTLADLDQFLTRNLNRPAVADLAAFVSSNGLSGSSQSWKIFEFSIDMAFCMALLIESPPGVLELLTRNLLLTGLINVLNETPENISTPDDIYNLLRWRTIQIPDKINDVLINRVNIRRLGKNWTELDGRGGIFATRPGFADLYVTHEEWHKYIAGEIAYIENVLPGEFKERKHFELDQTTQTTTLDTTNTKTQENSTQTTDTSQLSTQSTTDVSLSAHIDGKVDTSGQYGPTHVDTHLGGSLDYSQSQADSRASTQSRETVDRAVTTVMESVRQIKTTQTLTKVTDLEGHQLDNKGQKDAVVGIFRWVNKVSTVKLTKYPNRFLMEFVVPEPGAWLRWLSERNGTPGMLTTAPLPFTDDAGAPLNANSITRDNYLKIGGRYATQGLTPPPPLTQTVTNSIVCDLADMKEKQKYVVDKSLYVPDGYLASTWKVTEMTWFNWRAFMDSDGNDTKKDENGLIRIAVGAGAFWESPAPHGDDGSKSSPSPPALTVGPISQGAVPVAIQAIDLFGYSVNIELTCTVAPETFTAWQIKTFESIASSYYDLKQQNDQEKAKMQLSAAGGSNFGDSNNPETNKALVSTELKRQVIEFFLGSPFQGRGATDIPVDVTAEDTKNDTGPSINIQQAVSNAAEIEFLEQAFEWENLTFILFPYFWADRTRWEALAGTKGMDADFTEFLRSGAARVVVPARPKFAAQVNFYAQYGIIWGGGPVPAPNDPDYLSVSEEIKEQEKGPSDGTLVDTWEVTVPTPLIWLQNSGDLPENIVPYAS